MFQPAGVVGLMQARLCRTSVHTREYVGYDHAEQGHWGNNFFFSLIQDPLFGRLAASADGVGGFSAEETRLRSVITGLNKLRPRFVVVSGNLTDSSIGGDLFDAQLEAARKCLCRVSETTPLLFVPGPHTIGNSPTPANIDLYNAKFGADYFGFFYGGFRCLVVNSSLMIHNENAPELSARQDLWFAEEIEQSKLHATHIAIFSHHAWFLHSPEEEDSDLTFPRVLREKWLPMMRHSKIKFLFCSAMSPDNSSVIPQWEKCGGLVHKVKKNSASAARSQAEVDSGSTKTKYTPEDEAYVMKVEAEEDTDGVPLKPSEIVEQDTEKSDGHSSSSDDDEQRGESDEELTEKEEVLFHLRA